MDRSTLSGLFLLLASPSCKHPHRVCCPLSRCSVLQALSVTLLLRFLQSPCSCPWLWTGMMLPGLSSVHKGLLQVGEALSRGADALWWKEQRQGCSWRAPRAVLQIFSLGLLLACHPLGLCVLRAGQHSPCIGLYPAPRRARLTLFGSTAYYLTLGTPISS